MPPQAASGAWHRTWPEPPTRLYSNSTEDCRDRALGRPEFLSDQKAMSFLTASSTRSTEGMYASSIFQYG